MNRKKFIALMRKKYSLRAHMALILAATAASGAAASKILLEFGMASPAARYPLAVVIAYGIFFISVKLWLVYIIPSGTSDSSGSGDTVNVLTGLDISSDSAPAPAEAFPGGAGGTFGGSGASGSFETSGSLASHSSGGSSAGDAAGGILDGLDLDDGIGVLVVAIALCGMIAGILGSGIYLLYNAPSLLSDVAFNAFLAASLVRKSREMRDGYWTGSVLKGTWKPFLIILILTVLTGAAISHFLPGATKIQQVIEIIWKWATSDSVSK
jgi:hypothetical protein